MANWRLDPFTDNFKYATITDESNTVALDAVYSRYGFRLTEAPRIISGSDSLTVEEDVTGGATWTELSPGTSPSAGEYRLDETYDTGFVEFSASDDGKTFKVDYSGKGRIAQEASIGPLADAYYLLNDLTLGSGFDLKLSGTGRVEHGGDPAIGWIASGVAGYATGQTIKLKILEIGDWDMDSTVAVSIAHGLTWANILHANAVIRKDDDNVRTSAVVSGGTSGDAYISWTLSSGFINVEREDGGLFDGTNYNATSYNRGWIHIYYVD